MQYEFEAGDTEKSFDSEMFEAGVDHKSHESKSTNGVWYQRIICFGYNEARADALRDRVLDALQDEGKLELMKERAEKVEGLIRKLAINLLTVSQEDGLDSEDKAAIEQIIKMPGNRDDA